MKLRGKMQWLGCCLTAAVLLIGGLFGALHFFVGETSAYSGQMVWNFSYTGAYQTFTAPTDGNYQIELYGASGGWTRNNYYEVSNSGRGGYTRGTIWLNNGETLYVYVGGGTDYSVAGGWNGGGSGADAVEPSDMKARGGGGATDVRYFPTTPVGSDLDWNNVVGLRSRIMVAGGGGGVAAAYRTGDECDIDVGGGAGGGLVGSAGGVNQTRNGAGPAGGVGGTQTSGGGFGVGATGGTANYALCFGYTSSGGGGGGYWGGGSGTYFVNGGGGSSFISGLAGANAVDSSGNPTGQPNHYSGKVFINAVTTAGANALNTAGSARISLAPTISSITPNVGPLSGGNTITISGEFLTGATAVKIGGANCTSYTIVDDLTITCVVPARLAGAVDVSVTGASGLVTTAVNGYTYMVGLVSQVGGVWNYTYINGYQIFTAPVTNTYRIELWGASAPDSESGWTDPISGGRGGYTRGDIALTAGETLYVYVGNTASGLTGGWNGGGNAVVNVTGQVVGGRGGGGASDVRYFPSTPVGSDLDWNDVVGLRSRIMVAGGGGGGGAENDAWYCYGGNGGNGGGLNGGNSTESNATNTVGATQTSGNVFGIGGNGYYGGTTSCGGGGGGAGGGYYGGRASWMSAGAGGSSFISGLVGANAIDAGGAHTGQPNHYSGKVFSNAVTTAGANGAGAAGRGQIAIAPIIAGVSPSEGTTAGGTTLTITGTYFTNASAVKVGAQNCTSYTVVNDTTITCVTPAASNGRVGVSVTGPSGMMRTLDNVFTYRTPLTITAVSPNHGLTMGGESVTITGTGFASPGGISAGTPSAPVLAGATTMVNQTGTGATAHSFTIEPRYVYKFELWGGAGGGVGSWGGADGRGGYATGWYDARGSAANETAYAYAGQAGGLDWAGVGGQGGVRGGDGGNNWMDYTGGGGGSSEVRIGGTGLANRVIVAGGGGGKGSLAGGGTASGGNGDGFPAYPGGAGGVRGDGSGGSGVANNSTYEGSGGGGAGYLGGEGGLWGSTGGGGGGAGTSYIGGVVSLDSSNTAWFSTPGQAGTYGTAGNGRALVTRYKMMSVSEINLNIGILAGGNTITISGSGLGGVNAITVGGQNCTSLTVVNDTSVTCVVPSGASAGAVDVRVVDAGGGVVTVTNGYTYYLPVVTFDAGGTPAVCTNVVVVSDTQITCTTGAHAAGIVAVAVAIGSDTASLANAYEYLVPTYITLEWDDSEDSLEISGAASSGGTVLSESTTVIVSTNNAAGYLLKLSMNTSEQRLVCTTGAGANHYLGPATSASLGLNEWGYSLNSGSSWAAVPALASPVTVANTNAANESGDSTAVLFSGKLNNSTPACRYGGMVKWTASVK